MTRALLFLFGAWLLFTVFVTVFAASASKNEVRNLPKWLWILLCLFVPIIGGLLYLVLGRPNTPPGQSFRRTRVVAPDDDPQFLRDLAEKLKQEEEEPKNPEQGEDPSSDKDKS
ncbi:MAG: PLD nuclease N-terminal domain-containing protein [Actinomycetota bacterium]